MVQEEYDSRIPNSTSRCPLRGHRVCGVERRSDTPPWTRLCTSCIGCAQSAKVGAQPAHKGAFLLSARPNCGGKVVPQAPKGRISAMACSTYDSFRFLPTPSTAYAVPLPLQAGGRQVLGARGPPPPRWEASHLVLRSLCSPTSTAVTDSLDFRVTLLPYKSSSPGKR